MSIEYIEPLSRAWNRMTQALFGPFDLGKWLALGFTAFLAGLLEGQMGGSGSKYSIGRDVDWEDVADFPHNFWDWLLEHAVWLFLAIIGIAVVIVVIILFAWLSSRGKFMFLDNVVHDRDRVTQPWHQFQTEANSLFLWRLVFGLICSAVIIFLLIRGFFFATQVYQDGFNSSMMMTIVRMGLLVLFVIIIIAYISLFLNDFVVPIMYINNVTASQAWRLFLPLFIRHWVCFIIY